jgi:hypothetical protein
MRDTQDASMEAIRKASEQIRLSERAIWMQSRSNENKRRCIQHLDAACRALYWDRIQEAKQYLNGAIQHLRHIE